MPMHGRKIQYLLCILHDHSNCQQIEKCVGVSNRKAKEERLRSLTL